MNRKIINSGSDTNIADIRLANHQLLGTDYTTPHCRILYGGRDYLLARRDRE